MNQVVKISLPGIDVNESTDPNNFSLYVDEEEQDEHILLKEKSRGTVSSGGSHSHNLGYIPFFLIYGEVSSGLYQLATGYDAVSGIPRAKSTPNVLKTAGGDMKYFVFYDNMDT